MDHELQLGRIMRPQGSHNASSELQRIAQNPQVFVNIRAVNVWTQCCVVNCIGGGTVTKPPQVYRLNWELKSLEFLKLCWYFVSHQGFVLNKTYIFELNYQTRSLVSYLPKLSISSIKLSYFGCVQFPVLYHTWVWCQSHNPTLLIELKEIIIYYANGIGVILV